nr:metalloregulator ArsR/SmtB family transcription factor [Streptomyces sp. NBC_00830]
MLTGASDIEVLARFGRALADPIRCRILLALREAPAYPADLADTLGISRTRLSNHLACLRDCGLVVTAPDGKEGRAAWQGKGRCAPPAAGVAPTTASEADEACGCRPGCDCRS